MAEMGLYEAMRTLRAVRRLRPDPIPDDVLHRVLEAATWAPSGGNRQPWRIIVVKDPARKQRLGALYAERWAEYIKRYSNMPSDTPPSRPRDEPDAPSARATISRRISMKLQSSPFFASTRRVLAVTDAKLDRISIVGGGSVYPAVQNLLLACRARRAGVRIDHAPVRIRTRGQRAAFDSSALGNCRRRPDRLSGWPGARADLRASPVERDGISGFLG